MTLCGCTANFSNGKTPLESLKLIICQTGIKLGNQSKRIKFNSYSNTFV